MFWPTEESPPMFETRLFDAFSRTPAILVPIIYVPMCVAFVAVASHAGVQAPMIAAQVTGGFLMWTFAEYWLHRTLFHWEPDTRWGPKMHFILHGVHHTWVNDRFRLVMPPAVSAGVAVFFWLIFQGVAWVLSPALASTWVYCVFAGFAAGYINYDMTHYYIHHFRPRSKRYKRLMAHHNNHHYNHPELKFGVSTTLWDRVFGTL